jgi:hypothetical protein
VKPVVLVVEDDLRIRGRFGYVRGPVLTAAADARHRQLEARLLLELASGGLVDVLVGFARSGRRRPRPVTLVFRSPRRAPVKKQVLATVLTGPPDDHCAAVRFLAEGEKRR